MIHVMHLVKFDLEADSNIELNLLYNTIFM